MKNQNYFYLILLFLNFSCGAQIKTTTKFPQEIIQVDFQHWVGGQEQTGSGTNLRIFFKDSLAKGIVLQKLFFRGKEAIIKRQSATIYVAGFYYKPKNYDLATDDNPKTVKPKYVLKDNEAVIEYSKNKKNLRLKIQNIKEVEPEYYPVARPQND